jgi:hypothetical protein
MSGINNMISDISSLSKKVRKDLVTLTDIYSKLYEEVNHKFKEELIRQNGSISGLDDFYSLVITLKGDKIKVRNALSLLSSLKDISQFSVSEEALEEEKKKKEESDISDILEQVSNREVETTEFTETTIDEILEETDKN